MKSITINELKKILNKFNDSDIVKVDVNKEILDIENIKYENNFLILKAI